MASSRLVYGFDREVSDWVLERIPSVSSFGNCAAIGVELSGRLVAGTVFHSYEPSFGLCQISMAADSPVWAKKEIIAALLSYPFVQLQCWSAFTLTPASNERALKVNKHIGIKRKTVIPHAFGKGIHGVFCQMTQPEFERLYGVADG